MEVGATFGLNKLSVTDGEKQNQLGLEEFCIQVWVYRVKRFLRVWEWSDYLSFATIILVIREFITIKAEISVLPK